MAKVVPAPRVEVRTVRGYGFSPRYRVRKIASNGQFTGGPGETFNRRIYALQVARLWALGPVGKKALPVFLDGALVPFPTPPRWNPKAAKA